MTIETEIIDGITYLHLENENGMEVVLSEMGAGLYSIKIDGNEMLIAPKDKKAWESSTAYFGKTVGRLAGRLKDSSISYFGHDCHIASNEGKNALHGGVDGFSFKVFRSAINLDDDALVATFTYDSEDGEGGFAGDISLLVRYTLKKNENTLRIDFTAYSEKGALASLTNHAYFNLGGNEDVLNDSLQINADKVLTYGEGLIPESYIDLPTYLDFEEEKKISDNILDPHLDNGGVVGMDHGFLSLDHDEEEAFVTMENDAYKLEVFSSFPFVQCYSANFGPFGYQLSNGNIAKIHDAIAIEPQLDQLNRDSMLIAPKSHQKNHIIYKFTSKEGK